MCHKIGIGEKSFILNNFHSLNSISQRKEKLKLVAGTVIGIMETTKLWINRRCIETVIAGK